MIVVFSQYPSNRASPALARASRVNPIMATSLTPNRSPKNPPISCPAIRKAITTPPITALYLSISQPASLMKMSSTMGSTKRYNSERRHRKISRNEDLRENPFTILYDVTAGPLNTRANGFGTLGSLIPSFWNSCKRITRDIETTPKSTISMNKIGRSRQSSSISTPPM